MSVARWRYGDRECRLPREQMLVDIGVRTLRVPRWTRTRSPICCRVIAVVCCGRGAAVADAAIRVMRDWSPWTSTAVSR